MKKNKLKIFLTISALLSFAEIGFAQSNTMLLPIGAHEALTANTGIARSGSVGAVIYNPAGIASITGSKLSATGTAFYNDTVSVEGGGFLSDSKAKFSSIPSLVTAIFSKSNFNWSFSIITPQVENKELILVKPAEFSSVRSFNESQTSFGPSVGFSINQYLSLGFSIFGSQNNGDLSSTIYQSPASGAPDSLTQTNLNYSYRYAYGVAGVLYREDNYSFGLKITTPSIGVGGDIEKYHFKVVNGGSVNDPVHTKVKYEYKRPMEVGLGYRVNFPKSKFTLLVDATFQNAVKYESYNFNDSLEESSADTDLRSVQRTNIGLQYLFNKSKILNLGIQVNPKPEANGSSGFDYYGISGGIRTRDGLEDSSLGLFYIAGTRADSGVKIKNTYMGLILSSSLSILEAKKK